ncbi:trypsin-4-like isoform X2 [Neocloeon triangulifer]|uniref:trypsin-4-like isoform X2 n=1 Tax=Neocloeon triangulifer TaxID=2078957 RepID=UPI00286F1F34|nr:trypsin-4-like isoform X2 [Neocloeon triangulifer]
MRFSHVLSLCCFLLAAEATARNKRVVGGTPAADGEAAYSASIQNAAGEHFCGGVIVGKKTVLTSAVCAVFLNASDIRVKVGSADLSKASEYTVSKVVVHPDFLLKGRVPVNDLAALRIQSEIKFEDGKTKAATLPTKGQKTVQGEIVTVAGWGATKINGSASPLLMKIKIRIVNIDECSKAHKNIVDTIPDNQICAGVEDGSKDACQMDGGAGLVLENLVLGLASWGQGCGQKPGVYTELAPFRFWIDEQLN